MKRRVGDVTLNTIKISRFRAGLWVLLLAGVVIFAAQQFSQFSNWDAAGVGKLANMIFAVLTVWAVYLTGAFYSMRMGVIAAALTLGNTAFLDAGRAVFGNNGAEFTMGWIMVETLCFFAIGFCRQRKIYAAVLTVFLLLCAGIPLLTGFAGFDAVSPVEGWATVILGCVAAVVFLAGLWRSNSNIQMPGVIAWGVINAVFFPGGVIGVLPQAALLAAWLMENPEHRRGAARIIGSGVLMAMQAVPALLVLIWLYTAYAKPEDVQVPMLLPMIIYGILILCSWMAVRKFKYADRRAVIAIAFAASVATWVLLLVEPLRLQELNNIEKITGITETSVTEAGGK